MATKMFGSVEPFDAKHENWNEYVEKTEQLLIVNDITDDHKKTYSYERWNI